MMDQNEKMERLCAMVLQGLDRFALDIQSLKDRIDHHEQVLSSFAVIIGEYKDEIPKRIEEIIYKIDKSIDGKLADTDFAIADNNNLFKTAAVRLNEEVRNAYVVAADNLMDPVRERLDKIDARLAGLVRETSAR